ncbi:hypothetical protein DQ244_16735 [Blastococcus sp. TBT05-19]|uniref:hypothetical protein n=1 Tax=Blastococcus sp. TBT05-19 TaxID=2250581 RepID=UPI000DE8CBE9|nr:hypothetical protein [Blastococcus sp. TBT05-19]RBY88186.1 hypothetical protein DQ244_16735 [Blastococcus sp. TBT05-19]
MPTQADRPRSRAWGRRLLVATALAGGLASASAPPAAAEEGTPAAPAPTVRCSVTDERLAELSGLVVVGDQMLALNDGGSQVTVHGLDSACRVVDVQTAAVDPFDPEDLGVGPGGEVWVADTGDNNTERSTIALHVLRPGGAAALYRLTYPDGAHDAEALLMAPDGTPYVVTKEVLGSSGVYRPAAPLVDGGTVPLERVATVNVTLTGTPGGPVGRAGQLMITGGAVASDGSALALRTYTDAYVWPLSGSDVVGALGGTPVRVALPDSPQGEAISFAADSRTLVVASEGLPSDVTEVPVPGQATAAPAPASETAGPGLAALTEEGSPLPAALLAALGATLVVWVGSRILRRP